MSVMVITPPAPFLTPADIPGPHTATDAKIALIIAAVVEEVDGYTGWLGRCLAPQLLEWRGWSGCSSFGLPIGPVLEIESIQTETLAGQSSIVAPDAYRLADELLAPVVGAAWVREPLFRVRYWAGYGSRDPENSGNWRELVPARVKQAVILSVLHTMALGAENLFLRSEQVEGVGTTQYTVSPQAGEVIALAVSRFLDGLRVYA